MIRKIKSAAFRRTFGLDGSESIQSDGDPESLDFHL